MLRCIFIFLLLNLLRSSTYTITQEFFTEGFTDNDFNAWNPYGASLPLRKFSNCSTHRIFGGYDILVGDATNPSGITRTWTNLIPHYAITISLKLYKIDSWVNNTIFFMVDGVTAQLYTFNSSNGGTTDFCGNPSPIPDIINANFNDLVVPVTFTIAHTSTSLTILIVSNLMSNSGSWGIRDLLITMAACDQSCLTCSSSTSCTSCDPAYSLVMSGSFCICSSGLRQKYIPCTSPPCAVCLAGLCSNGYYYSTITTYCQPCNVACSTCSSSVNSAATCSSCTLNGYVGTPHTTACFSCFSGCLTCSTTASTSCTSCLYRYFYSSSTNTCLQTCPAGTYGEEKLATCLTCSSPCATCDGNNGGSYYCLSCIAGKYLYNYICYASCPYSLLGYQGGCVATCPSSTYADSFTLTCLSCTSNCSQCTNGTSCFICSSSTYMYNGLCYSPCPATFYGSNQTQLCLSCHTSCLTCNGPFSDNCLSCPGTILISNICYATCPSNTYSAICLACDSTCLTCSGASSTNCLTCSSPLFYHFNFSSCLSTCNKGQLSNNYNFTCTKCPAMMVAYFQSCQYCSTTCLECNGISFLQCTSCSTSASLVKSTCVRNDDKTIIYMPNLSNNSLRSSFIAIFFINFFIAIFLEIIFKYKTNLLSMIELIQILSYTQFLTIELSESTQRLAHFLYLTNFSAFLSPINVSPHPSLPSKFQVIGKTGIFLADAFGIQLVILICSILLLAARYLSLKSQFFLKVYKKINPYILTYTFRLVLLELSLNIMLYIYCFDATSGVGAGSLLLLIFDLFLLVLSLCWRIKTEQDGTQIALFYCNQMGQPPNKQHQYLANEDQATNSLQQKIKKSKILPSLMELLLKLPIPITILYFVGNLSTQTICFFIYFAFYLLLVIIIPVRRKIYRFTMLMNSSFLVINAFGAILVSKQLTTSYYFDGIWFTIIFLLFLITLMQGISNYHFFIDFLGYVKYQIKNGFSKAEEPKKQEESESNLASQEEQSVVFQKKQKQRQVPINAKSMKYKNNITNWSEDKQ